MSSPGWLTSLRLLSDPGHVHLWPYRGRERAGGQRTASSGLSPSRDVHCFPSPPSGLTSCKGAADGEGGAVRVPPTFQPFPDPVPSASGLGAFQTLSPVLPSCSQGRSQVLGLKGVLSPAVTSFQWPLWPQCSGPGAWLLPGVDVFSPWDGLEGSCAAFFRFVLRN